MVDYKEMIPKTIHYCWFGRNKQPEIVHRCIASWKSTCPEFNIKEWNETNFPIHQFPFAKKMYEEKKWAFVADYARLFILEQEGGVYLDTDMLLVRDLSPILVAECVLGEEAPGIISAGMIASTPRHPFIRECRKRYDEGRELATIPRVLTSVYASYPETEKLTVYPPKAFYPFDADHIQNYQGQDLEPETYGVHLWQYSWGHPLNKFFKKIGIYRIGKSVVERLGVKRLLKKLLGFI